jgi:16S rRNA (cytosine967-C5)-methyltransferase
MGQTFLFSLMNKTSLIGHVIELHDAILRVTHPADSIVKEFLRKRHYLGSKDRRFISETIYDLLRNFKLLNLFVHEAFKAIGETATGAASASIATYAALAVKLKDENVDVLLPEVSGLWRVYVPSVECRLFLDALQKSELPGSIQADPVQRLSFTYSFPEMIVREWVERFGPEEAGKLCSALNQPAPITIRVNALKATVEECRHALEREGIMSQPTTLSPQGLILEKRINAQALRVFKEGYFEMQDEGSQLLSMMVDPEPGATVVDACAGGGGKTLHLAALMQNKGSLIAIDVDDRRLANVRLRVERGGVSIAQLFLAGRDVGTLNSWMGKADHVLIDAPCTGVGTFRRNPGAKLLFKEESVKRMSQTQREVLERYSPFVKPGGRLVYSTCSLLREENEEVVERFLSAHPEFSLQPVVPTLEKHGIKLENSSSFLTLLPHRTSTDGFFAAIMRRE